MIALMEIPPAGSPMARTVAEHPGGTPIADFIGLGAMADTSKRNNCDQGLKHC